MFGIGITGDKIAGATSHFIRQIWRYNQHVADSVQAVLTVGMPTLAVLVGILINNNRLSDFNSRLSDINNRISELRDNIDVRFRALEQTLDARFAEQKAELLRVEQVMDARLRHLEERG
jgi:hypothetical protein